MTLDPSASLAGYAVDLIALDGSVTSTLAFGRRHAERRHADLECAEPALVRRRPPHAQNPQADATLSSLTHRPHLGQSSRSGPSPSHYPPSTIPPLPLAPDLLQHRHQQETVEAQVGRLGQIGEARRRPCPAPRSSAPGSRRRPPTRGRDAPPRSGRPARARSRRSCGTRRPAGRAPRPTSRRQPRCSETARPPAAGPAIARP